MAAFAPPIRRGDFVYSSVLYADPGNDNHHPRASIADLAALLRPEGPNLYTKPGKPAPATPSKDPPWHWYAAQLIHYGLPVTKDKNGAKVRLLTAMNQFKLEIPAWILKMEGEMKKEWESENRKAKRQGSGGGGGATKAKPKAKKESAETASGGLAQMPSVPFSINVNVSMASGTAVPLQTGKMPTGSASKKAKRKRDDDDDSDEKSVSKKGTGRARSATKSPAKTKKATASPITSSLSRLAGAYSTPQVARKPVKSPRTKKETASSSPYTSPPVKQEGSRSGYASARPRNGHVKQEEQPQPTIMLSGGYVVEYINIDAQAHIDVYKDTNRGVWWANAVLSMDDDERQFVIKMDPGPDLSRLGRAVTLGWRMRSMYTDEVTFGSGRTGEATFFEDGRLIVDLYNVPGFGNVEMSGHRIHGGSRPGDLQQDWDHFTRIAYGR